MYMFFLRLNGQQIMNTRSSEQLCFPIGHKKYLLPPNGQENNKLDTFLKTQFLKANNFFYFKFKKILNGKVLDLSFFSVFLFFVYSYV